MIIFCKNLILTPRVRGGGRGFPAKIFSTIVPLSAVATMLLHS